MDFHLLYLDGDLIPNILTTEEANTNSLHAKLLHPYTDVTIRSFTTLEEAENEIDSTYQ